MPDRQNTISNLETNIRWIEDHEQHQFPGWGNVTMAMRDAVELLKEQPEIVLCKDCKHYMTIHCTCDGCCISDDWYCADGKRAEKS